jgi:HK97 family phage portal protein
MNVIQKALLRLAGLKAYPGESYSLADVALGRALSDSSSAAGITVNIEIAQKLSAWWGCVRILSETIAALPRALYRDMGNGVLRKATDHPLHNIISSAPNSNMTSVEFFEQQLFWLCADGNAYSYRENNQSGEPITLTPLESTEVKPALNKATGLVEFAVNDRGKWETLPREKIWHIKGFGRDGLKGLSPLGAARDALGAAKAQEDFGAKFFAEGGVPAGTVTIEKFLNQDQRLIARDNLQQLLGGLGNAHKWALMEGGMKPEPFKAMPLEDMQFLVSRVHSIREICRFYRIPPHMVADLERATFCLPAGTEVLTDRGPLPVETIKAGDIVWSRDNGSWVKAKVSNAICSGEDEILNIRTTNRTLRANARHRVMVRRKYSAVRNGKRSPKIEWRTEYVAAGELRIGDTIVTAGRLPVEGLKQTPTRQASIGFMEFCGLLIGDGNVFPDTGSVQIARSETAEYMDHYRAVMVSEFRSYDGGNGRGDQTLVALKPVVLTEGGRQTRFKSVIAARELQRLGFCGTAKTKTIPQWVFTLDEDRRLAFLRGYLDADGSVDKLGRISFSSVNENLLSQVRHLVIGCGIPVTNLRQQIGVTTLPNGKQARVSQWSFTCSDAGANVRIGSNDPRYMERLLSAKPFYRKARKYPRFGGRDFEGNGVELSRINSIEHEPIEPVYDIEVENTHNFVADGVIVHNSNIEHMSQEFVTFTLMPYFTRIEAALKRWLLPATDRDSLYLRFNYEGLLRADSAGRAAFYSQGLQNGWISRNEVRAKENLNRSDAEGMDDYTVQVNMTTIDKLGEMPEPTDVPKPEPIKSHDVPVAPSTQHFNLVMPETMKQELAQRIEFTGLDELTEAMKENTAALTNSMKLVALGLKKTSDQAANNTTAIVSQLKNVVVNIEKNMNETRELMTADREVYEDENGVAKGTRVVLRKKMETT